MNVVELGSRLSWWRGALLGVVLAVAAGVLGMHVLTAGHSAHGVGAGAHVTESASHDEGVVPVDAVTSHVEHAHADGSTRTHEHERVGDHTATTGVPSTVSSVLGGTDPGDVGPLVATHVVTSIPACDTDCTSGMGSVCLAVILLVLLLLHRPGDGWGSRQAGRIVLAHPVLALGVGPARPSLVQLCVSRT